MSEWNPCHVEDDGRVRFRWDEDVQAHDVDVEVDAAVSSDEVTCEVCLGEYCPDVAKKPHTVRLSSYLSVCLWTKPQVSPERQLI